jgi:hypothetical protein
MTDQTDMGSVKPADIPLKLPADGEPEYEVSFGNWICFRHQAEKHSLIWIRWKEQISATV